MDCALYAEEEHEMKGAAVQRISKKDLRLAFLDVVKQENQLFDLLHDNDEDDSDNDNSSTESERDEDDLNINKNE
eukprot:14139185-Ditylum_brightwellii.AAC.1